MFSVPQKATRPVSITQDTCRPRVVVDPGTRRSLLHGNREISIVVPASRGRDVVGKAGGRTRGSEEAVEQGGLSRCGDRGAKGWGQGECGSAKHGPDAEPG